MIVQNDLKGEGHFNFTSNAAEGKSDHIEVQGIASGRFTLAIKNSGKEPSSESPISLMTLKNKDQDKHTTHIQLENGYVDLGAYRYILTQRNNDYRLYSPLKDAYNHTDNSAATSKIDALKTLIQQEEQRVSTLNQETQQAAQKNQQAQHALNEASSRLTQAQQTLNSMLNQMRLTNRRFRTNRMILQSQQQIRVLQAEVNNLKRQSTISERDLKSIEQRLNTAQNAIANTQKQLANELESLDKLLRAEAKSRCAAEKNAQYCELALLASMDELGEQQQKTWVSQTANMALSEFSAQTNSLLHIERQLNQQRLMPQQSNVWLNQSYLQANYGSSLYRQYQQKAQLSQVGINSSLNDQWLLGAAFSTQHSQHHFDEELNGSAQTKMASIYAKWQDTSGLFAILNSNIAKTKNRLYDSQFHRHSYTLGTGVGQNIDIYGLKLQPHFGMNYYHFGNVRYLFNDAQIHTPKQHFTSYHAGLKVSKSFGEQWQFTPFASYYYQDASRKTLNVHINDMAFQQRFGRLNHFETGVNIHHQRWQINTTLGYANGNEMKNQKSANLRIGYRW